MKLSLDQSVSKKMANALRQNHTVINHAVNSESDASWVSYGFLNGAEVFVTSDRGVQQMIEILRIIEREKYGHIQYVKATQNLMHDLKLLHNKGE